MEGSLKLSKFDDREKEDPTLFKSLIGSLRYLTSTRPNIMYVVSVVFHFMESPTSTHMKAKEVELVHVKAQDHVANIFTKFLKFEDFKRLKARLGVYNFPSKEEHSSINWDLKAPIKFKRKFYKEAIRASMFYNHECWPMKCQKRKKSVAK
ncbi:hypothetical protein CR513_06426, partial [Mucuna pruriens]